MEETSGNTIQRTTEWSGWRESNAITWSIGVEIMEWDLVDKWTTEAKIHDGNKDMLNTYWRHFEEYIHPSYKPTNCSSGT